MAVVVVGGLLPGGTEASGAARTLLLARGLARLAWQGLPEVLQRSASSCKACSKVSQLSQPSIGCPRTSFPVLTVTGFLGSSDSSSVSCKTCTALSSVGHVVLTWRLLPVDNSKGTVSGGGDFTFIVPFGGHFTSFIVPFGGHFTGGSFRGGAAGAVTS